MYTALLTEQPRCLGLAGHRNANSLYLGLAGHRIRADLETMSQSQIVIRTHILFHILCCPSCLHPWGCDKNAEDLCFVETWIRQIRWHHSSSPETLGPLRQMWVQQNQFGWSANVVALRSCQCKSVWPVPQIDAFHICRKCRLLVPSVSFLHTVICSFGFFQAIFKILVCRNFCIHARVPGSKPGIVPASSPTPHFIHELEMDLACFSAGISKQFPKLLRLGRPVTMNPTWNHYDVGTVHFSHELWKSVFTFR